MADVSIIIKAIDQATGTLSGVTGELDKMDAKGSKLAGVLKGGLVLGAGAAVAGIGALGAVLGTSISAASEAEEIGAQLNAVLESTGGIAGMTADAINDHALALSEMTRFEDDAIVAAQSLLLTFTKVGKDVFPDATEATLDMAQSLKIDLKSASMLVGKALNDPIKGMTALTRSGIQFTEAQKATIEAMVAMGDTVGAQRIILKELETQFGGSAKAAGDTMAGQLDILKNSLGNVKEEIGGALIPVIKQLEEWAGPKLITGFQRLSDWLTGGIDDIREFASKLGSAKEIVGEIVSDVNAGRKIRWMDLFDLAGLFTENWKLKVTFAETVQDIEKFAADVKAAYDTGGLFAAIEEGGSQIGAAIASTFESIDWETIRTSITTYWDTTLQPALKTAIANLAEYTKIDTSLTTQLGTALGDLMGNAFIQAAETSQQGLSAKIGTALGSAFGNSVDGTAFWDAFSSNLRKGLVPTNLQTAISSVMDAMLAKIIADHPIIATYVGTLQDIVKNLQAAGEKYGTTREAFLLGFNNPFAGVASVIRDVVAAIQEAINKWWEWVGATGRNPSPGHGMPHDPAGYVLPAPTRRSGAATGMGGGLAAMPVTININAPGGNPRAVALAAQEGVLAAARSMGLA